MSLELTLYRDLLGDIKVRVRTAQHKAALSANTEMILLYWDIGRLIAERQEQEGWGAGVIPRLAVDLKNELPEQKGFSDTNLKRMVQFSREYPGLFSMGARSVPPLSPSSDSASQPSPSDKIGAQLVPQSVKDPAGVAMALQAFAQLSWGHNVILIQKLKHPQTHRRCRLRTHSRLACCAGLQPAQYRSDRNGTFPRPAQAGKEMTAERTATPLLTLTAEVATIAARVNGHLKKMGAVWK